MHGAGVEPAQPERAVYSRLVSPMTRPMLGVIRGIRTRHFRDHNPACFLYTMNTMNTMTSLFRDAGGSVMPSLAYPQPESNRRPPASETGALSTELRGSVQRSGGWTRTSMPRVTTADPAIG